MTLANRLSRLEEKMGARVGDEVITLWDWQACPVLDAEIVKMPERWKGGGSYGRAVLLDGSEMPICYDKAAFDVPCGMICGDSRFKGKLRLRRGEIGMVFMGVDAKNYGASPGDEHLPEYQIC